jgi:Ca2+-binding RTX toxin-like protein
MRALSRVLAAITVVLCFAGTAAADHTKIFDDPLGDSGTAPDFSRLRVVSHLEGTLLFSTQVANRAGFEDQDNYRIALDTDRNATTPGVNAVRGSEILIVIREFIGGFTVFLYVWDDDLADYGEVEPPVEWGYGAGPFAQIRMRDFGLAFDDRIDLSIDSFNEDTDDADVAPNGTGRWSFQIRRCDIEGSRRDDRLSGTGRDDFICGFRGDDSMFGRRGADQMLGGPGGDHLEGGRGPDVIEGGRGPDDIYSGGGDDFVYVRGGGSDTVRCGSGNDEVEADASDRLIGC